MQLASLGTTATRFSTIEGQLQVRPEPLATFVLTRQHQKVRILDCHSLAVAVPVSDLTAGFGGLLPVTSVRAAR